MAWLIDIRWYQINKQGISIIPFVTRAWTTKIICPAVDAAAKLRLESKAFRGEVLKVISHLQDWGWWHRLAAAYDWYTSIQYIVKYTCILTNIYIYNILFYHSIWLYSIIVCILYMIYCSTLLFICSQWSNDALRIYDGMLQSRYPGKICVNQHVYFSTSPTVWKCLQDAAGISGLYQVMRPET